MLRAKIAAPFLAACLLTQVATPASAESTFTVANNGGFLVEAEWFNWETRERTIRNLAAGQSTTFSDAGGGRRGYKLTISVYRGIPTDGALNFLEGKTSMNEACGVPTYIGTTDPRLNAPSMAFTVTGSTFMERCTRS
ncbi:hypothetical protein ACM64Y_01220 [Novispirillum sp. DQ9]|uniref:hypothetical protein n=1 Tax=Novispirillum sp. DQ9 TaxID=3398612 RepID=UPI003C7B6585